MKKPELLKLLEGVPDDAEIVLSKDSEGNEYSPLAARSFPARYEPTTEYYGDVYIPSTENPSVTEDGDPIPQEAVPCIVLWPTN